MSTTLFAISPSIYETLLLSFALFILAKNSDGKRDQSRWILLKSSAMLFPW